MGSCIDQTNNMHSEEFPLASLLQCAAPFFLLLYLAFYNFLKESAFEMLYPYEALVIHNEIQPSIFTKKYRSVIQFSIVSMVPC